MGNNSIKNNLTKEDIISDIILSMGADIQDINVYILVEGEGDVSLIRPFLKENVIIYESYDGKHGVEYIVGEYFYKNEKVIGIRDRDYQLQAISEKIFYYDYGCMEMMIVSNEDVFSNLCYEYYRGELSSKELRDYIFQQLKPLSIIRLHNEREQWEIILKGLSLNNVWKEKDNEIDNDAIIDKINVMNNGFINESLYRRIKEESMIEWKKEDFFSYTQGHDFFTLFTIICNQYRKRGIKSSEAEASARCIFRWSDMIKTLLYRQIIMYAKEKNLKIMSESI